MSRRYGLTAAAAAGLVLSFLPGGAATAASPPGIAAQFLPLPATVAPPAPLPLPPPINPGVAAAPPAGISPQLRQGGPVFALPQPASPAYPPMALPGPIDQQKTGSYRSYLEGQQRLLERAGTSPGDPLAREIQQQLQQLDQADSAR